MTDPPESIDETIRAHDARGYAKVGDVFRGFFDRKWDTGSAVAVYHRGEPDVQLTGVSSIIGPGSPRLGDGDVGSARPGDVGGSGGVGRR